MLLLSAVIAFVVSQLQSYYSIAATSHRRIKMLSLCMGRFLHSQ